MIPILYNYFTKIFLVQHDPITPSREACVVFISLLLDDIGVCP